MNTTTTLCVSLQAVKDKCTEDAGVSSIPDEPTVANYADRRKLCASKACQEYASIIRSQVSAKCEQAVSTEALSPNGIHSPDYCTALTSTKARALVALPTDEVETANSTATPTPQAPTPAPTIKPPVPLPAPSSTSSPPSTTRELTPKTTPVQTTTPAAEPVTTTPPATPASDTLAPPAVLEPHSSSPNVPPVPSSTATEETTIPPVVVTPPPTPVTVPTPGTDTSTPPAPTTTNTPPTVTTSPPPVPPPTTPSPPANPTTVPNQTTPTPVTTPATTIAPPHSQPTTTPSSPETPSSAAPWSGSAPKATPAPQPPAASQSAVIIATMKPPPQTSTPSTSVAQATKSVNATATSSDVSTGTPMVASAASETPVASATGLIDQPTVSTSPTTSPLAESSASPTSPPTGGLSQSDAGFSPTVIAISGGVVLLVVVFAIVLVRIAQTKRRRRTFEYDEDMGSKYQDINSPRTAAGTTMSVPWAGSVLATSRISLEKIQRGPIVSQGGYGEVSRGYYNGQEVAIKRLLVSRRRDLVSIHDFLEEIKLTATLDHECIAKFIGVAWDSPSDLCMVSEYVPGGDLRSLLSRRAREGGARGFDDDKLRIAMQIAHALTYLHTLQPVVVHRDLKSRNVLLTAQMDAKLIDFGVSTERCDMTMTAGVGTSLWMAPEMMLGQRYDEKADVFSFGVVLSELDTHELPYSHMRESASGRLMNDMVVMQLVSQGQSIPEFSESADPRIVELARDCLQLDPDKRPSASEVLYLIHRTRRAGALV